MASPITLIIVFLHQVIDRTAITCKQFFLELNEYQENTI